MVRWIACVAAVTVVALGMGVAQEQGGKKKRQKLQLPVGTWVKEVGDAKIQFNIRPKNMFTIVNKGEEKISVVSDIGFTRDGILFGRISKVRPKNIPNGPEAGVLFSFKYKVEGKKMTISNFTGPDSEEAAQLIEGVYTQIKAAEKKRKKKANDG